MCTKNISSLAVLFLFVITPYLSGQNSQPLGDVARQLRQGNKSSTPAAAPSTTERLHAENKPPTASFVDVGAKARQNEAERSSNGAGQLLKLEKFDVIEQIAHSARVGKTRLGGGGWELYTIYQGLSTPEEGRQATDADWGARIELLQRWTSLYPNSITARVALAEAYENYGWKARGGGYADKITDQGRKLFDERVNLAKTTLEEARNLKERCPHWYVVMQDVALDQGWDKPEAAALFQEAIAFEPDYYYYYQEYTRYLLPKWYGEEGDAESFANRVLSEIGGKQGTTTYFEIAASVAGNAGSNDTTLKNMSWDRIKQGYAAAVEQYGTSALKLNCLAYIAVTMHDAETARVTFEQIGSNWVNSVWKRKDFDDANVWAWQFAPFSNWTKAITSAVEMNMKTPEGQQYDAQIAKQFAHQFPVPVKFCVDSVRTPLANFDWYIQLTEEGTVRRLLAAPSTQVSECLSDQLVTAKFTTPPRPAYWIKITMQFVP